MVALCSVIEKSFRRFREPRDTWAECRNTGVCSATYKRNT